MCTYTIIIYCWFHFVLDIVCQILRNFVDVLNNLLNYVCVVHMYLAAQEQIKIRTIWEHDDHAKRVDVDCLATKYAVLISTVSLASPCLHGCSMNRLGVLYRRKELRDIILYSEDGTNSGENCITYLFHINYIYKLKIMSKQDCSRYHWPIMLIFCVWVIHFHLSIISYFA